MNLHSASLALTLMLASAGATAQPAAAPLPAMKFLSSIPSDEMYDRLKATPALSLLDKELYGSPITLLVTHSLSPTEGGKAAGFLTSILAGGTLGLVPVVESNNLVIRYDLLVHGRPLATYSFDRKLTRATNMWKGPGDFLDVLGKDGTLWLYDTTESLAEQLAADPRIADLVGEYTFYFGEASPEMADSDDQATEAAAEEPATDVDATNRLESNCMVSSLPMDADRARRARQAAA